MWFPQSLDIYVLESSGSLDCHQQYPTKSRLPTSSILKKCGPGFPANSQPNIGGAVCGKRDKKLLKVLLILYKVVHKLTLLFLCVALKDSKIWAGRPDRPPPISLQPLPRRITLGACLIIRLWARRPEWALPILHQEILRIMKIFLRTSAIWRPDHLGLLLQNLHRRLSRMMFPRPTLNMPLLGGTTRRSPL